MVVFYFCSLALFQITSPKSVYTKLYLFISLLHITLLHLLNCVYVYFWFLKFWRWYRKKIFSRCWRRYTRFWYPYRKRWWLSSEQFRFFLCHLDLQKWRCIGWWQYHAFNEWWQNWYRACLIRFGWCNWKICIGYGWCVQKLKK